VNAAHSLRYADTIQVTLIGSSLVTLSLVAPAGIKCESIFKISEGRPNPADYLKNGEVTMMMITSGGDEPDLRDGKDLRRLALTLQVRSQGFVVWLLCDALLVVFLRLAMLHAR
jgi:hypothetical protein